MSRLLSQYLLSTILTIHFFFPFLSHNVFYNAPFQSKPWWKGNGFDEMLQTCYFYIRYISFWSTMNHKLVVSFDFPEACFQFFLQVFTESIAHTWGWPNSQRPNAKCSSIRPSWPGGNRWMMTVTRTFCSTCWYIWAIAGIIGFIIGSYWMTRLHHHTIQTENCFPPEKFLQSASDILRAECFE